MTRLSVVMPLYNNAAHFPEAVESILDQSFSDFELVVIDDASRDASPELLCSYAKKDGRIRPIFLRRNIGVARVRQRGLEEARAALVARMDSDDWSPPRRFEKQIAFLDKHPEVGMVGCSYFRFKGSPDDKRLEIRLPSMATVSCHSFSYRAARLKICFPSTVYRRDLALAVGGYRSFFSKGAEDRDFGLRMQEKTKAVNLPDLLYGYRKNPASVFVQNRAALDASQIVAELCAIRRRCGFADPIDLAQPLARLPQVLGLPPFVTLEDLQQDPLWAAALMGSWLRKKHVSTAVRVYLYAGLLRGCLRSQIGLASLGKAVAMLDAAAVG